MYSKKIWDSETIAASGSAESAVIDLNAHSRHGNCSLQFEVSGDGTVKFEYEVSNDGSTFITKTGSPIASGIGKTSGPGSDGKDLVLFDPEPSAKLKIKVTETGTSDDAVVSATVLIAS